MRREKELIRKLIELRDDLLSSTKPLDRIRAQGVNLAIYEVKNAFAAERKRAARSATKAIRGGGR